jgi:hypothetical protein
MGGRERIGFAAGERQLELLQGQRGESDLCLVEGSFYLLAACEVEAPASVQVDSYLGVDLGVKNIAVDSNANQYSGGQVNGLRKRHFKLRSRWQSKGTKSAKRLPGKAPAEGTALCQAGKSSDCEGTGAAVCMQRLSDGERQTRALGD